MQFDSRESMPQLRFWPALAAILIVLYLVTVLSIPDVIEVTLLPASLLLIIRFLAVRAVVYQIRVSEGSHVHRFWQLLGAGLLLWLLADMSWLAQRVFTGTAPDIPSFSHLLRFSGYFAIIFAVTYYPRASSEYEGIVREGLDVPIILLSIMSIAWLALLKPSLIQQSTALPQIFWAYLTPFLDIFALVLVARAILILEFSSAAKVPLFLMISFMILGVTDVIDAYRLIIQIPEPSESVWIGRMVAISLIGFIASQPGVAIDVSAAEKLRPGSRWGSILNYLMPIAFMLSALVLIFFDWWISREPDWFGVAGAGLLTLLMFARQGAIIGQQEMRQFKALVDATQDVAFICDVDGKLRMANPALDELLGTSFEPKGDIHISRFMGFEEPVLAGISDILETATQTGWSGEVDLIRRDGSRFPALVSLSPFENIRWGGVFLAGTAHDLSPVRDREDQLREALQEVGAARSELANLNAELELKVADRTNELQDTVQDLARLNEELQTLDQLKDEFVALVSHELRAPLTNIRSGIEVVLEHGPNLSEKTHESLELVQTEIYRLMYFVESILDLSALEAGGVQFDSVPIELRPSALAARARLSPKDELERVQINIQEDLPPVLADERALVSVLFHLMDNSIKYAPTGEIEVCAVEKGDYITVTVRDEGPGIPEEEHEKVFEMFHRLDSSDAREVYGHGLGLPMVRRFVEAMDGSVMIVPVDDVGTSVEFTLQKADNL